MPGNENIVSTSQADRIQSSVDDLPVAIGVRLIARGHLADALEAHSRLRGQRDTEALHDFRVALRRLRSTIRANRATLDDTVKKSDRRALRAIARATSAARDLEVQLGWLRKRRRRMGEPAATAAREMASRLRERKHEADRRAMSALGRFPKAHDRLQERLTRYTSEIDPVDPLRTPTAAETAAATATLYAANLSSRLSAVRSVEDGTRAHGARIAGKRLRYLLEPFRASVANGEATIELLRSFQDDLGDLHDLDVMLGLVGAELARTRKHARRHRDEAPPDNTPATTIEMALGEEGTSAATAASVVEGAGSTEPVRVAQPEPPEAEAFAAMASLEEYVRLQRDATFQAVQKTWLGSNAGGIFREVDEFTAALRTHVVPEVEIERKFLLRGMPRRKGARSIRIDQGWLPGERLLERIRRIREADGTMRYYRALKTGRGLTRREIEEETSEHVYRTLWPLTRGRRIAKRRMIVDDTDFTWEIDRFYGRDLVLAEVEVPSPETPVVPPRWLEKWVIREVTGESEYVNINLAE
jgi:CHAD domain-containing protein/CYTH domain-containing protein